MKYVPSALVGQLSRSAGSTTASRNRFGSYFRNRIMPVNPNTSKQSTVRNNIQELSQAWKDLTPAQRTGWAALGAQMTRQDSLGQAYNLTGLQAFTSLNMNLKTLSASALFDAPILAAVNQLDTLTITATAA